MSKRIFLTGAAGFIGFHLAQYLKNRGDIVIGYDNFNDYYNPSLKRQREALLAKQGITVIEGDILDEKKLSQAVSAHQTTHFVHLAAQAGVRYSLTNPDVYIKVNIEGFLRVLEICRKIEGVKLIYASSSSVYGLNDKVPFSVSDRTDRQASLYGVTKKSNELMAQTYHHLYGLPVTGLRFFTVYGPWGRPDMAYFSFAKAISEGRPIDLYNHGKMQRDFTYIDDIVEGTASAIDLGAPLKLYNLGNNQPVELMEMVATLEKLLEKKAVVNGLPMQQGDVLATYAGIEDSSDQLNFHPKTSLRKGLTEFINWYRCHFTNI